MVNFIILFVFSISIPTSVAMECACANDTVHIRDSADVSGNILGNAHKGDCIPFTGHMATSGMHNWANVMYINQSAWVALDWFTFRNCSDLTGSKVQLPGCPRIVTRQEWQAMPPSHTMSLLTQTPELVFIHHGASSECHTEDDCAAKVRGYQRYHMTAPPAGHGWWDIGYSFVVGEDGNVYEARGWDKVGAHTKNYNDVGLGICIIGDFRTHLPNDAALSAVKQLIQCGVDNGKISANYILKGHRDVGNTECPGQSLYDLIQTWPHYRRN